MVTQTASSCPTCSQPTKDLVLLRDLECSCHCQTCRDTGEIEVTIVPPAPSTPYTYGRGCSDCCEHYDMDDGFCLDCGEDRTEDLAAAAYDRAKGERYE